MRRTLPQGVVGPGFNDDFGDTYGLIYGFTADNGFSHRELRDYVEDIRSKLLQVPDVSKIEILGAQDEQIYVEFSTRQLAGLGIDRAALVAALQAQNAVIPAGSIQTGDEKLSIRVTGAFRSENDLLDVNFLSNGRLIRLRDIAEVRRIAGRSAAAPVPRQWQAGHRPRHRHARRRRHSGARPECEKGASTPRMADLPVGIDVALVSDQPVVVKNAIGEFMESLWQAIAIIMACQHRQPRLPPRRGGRPVDPADDRDHLPDHGIHRHRPAAHFARRADHCARPAGRRRHDHGRCDDLAHGGGRQQGKGRDLRL